MTRLLRSFNQKKNQTNKNLHIFGDVSFRNRSEEEDDDSGDRFPVACLVTFHRPRNIPTTSNTTMLPEAGIREAKQKYKYR